MYLPSLFEVMLSLNKFIFTFNNSFFLFILAPPAKQRGDQTITSEDDLVAPSLDTEVFTSKNTPDTKKNEVQVTSSSQVKERKGNIFITTGLLAKQNICI
jgi:hypothetical protein